MKDNKKIDSLRNSYMDIKIPDNLDYVVNDALNNKKITKKIERRKKFTVLAASVAIVVGVVNISPSIADALENIPVIGNVIKVINLKNYKINENGFDVSIDVPKIEGLKDKELEYKMNKEFEEEGKKLYEQYLKDIKELEALGLEGREYAESWYEVNTNNEKILSIIIYNFTAQGSSNTTRKIYNIDKENSTVLTLEGIFKDDTYIDVISENIKEQMRERMKENKEDVYWIDNDGFTEFEKINKDQGFYINENDEIVICFDKYEAGPGSQGLVEFTIPKEITDNLMK